MDPGQDTNEEGLAANRSVNAHANNNYHSDVFVYDLVMLH